MASFKTMLENVYSYNPFKCLTTLTVITDPYLAYCYSILNAITILCLILCAISEVCNGLYFQWAQGHSRAGLSYLVSWGPSFLKYKTGIIRVPVS